MCAILPLVGLALSACGDDGSPTGEDEDPKSPRPAIIGPSYPETPAKVPLVLPDVPPTDSERIAYFVSLLGNGDQEELAWAREMLSRAGPAAVRPLAEGSIRAMERNAMLGENILGMFDGSLDGTAALPEIRMAAKHRAVRIRMAAANALGYINRPEVVPILLDLASEGTPLVTKAAFRALDRLQSKAGARGLRGRFATVLAPEYRPSAIRVIAKNLPKEEAVAFLRTLLTEKELSFLIPAILMLADLEVDEGRDLLHERLQAANLAPFERAALIQALAELQDTRVLPLLIETVGQGGFAGKLTTVAVLSNYRQPAARAAMLEMTKAVDGNVRREAWHSLWLSGYEEALPRIHLLLRSSDPADRRIAATLLGELEQAESASHLAGALPHETERSVVMALAMALGKLGVPSSAGAVVAALARDTETRPSLAVMSNNLGSALLLYEDIDEDARNALAALAGSANPAHRLNATRALLRHGRGAACRKALLANLSDPEAGVRELAAQAWLRFPGADVGPLVEAYEKETDPARARTMADLALRLANRWGE